MTPMVTRHSILPLFLLLIVLAVLAVPAPARAQAQTPAAPQDAPLLRAAVGASYLREQGIGGGPSTSYKKGWVVSVDRPLFGRFAVVGEIGSSFHTNLAVETDSLLGVFGGVRFDVWDLGPIQLFAQALVGVERFSAPGFSEHGIAVQPGGGVDVAITRRVAVRAQGDFRAAHEEGVTFHESRALGAVVIAIGR